MMLGKVAANRNYLNLYVSLLLASVILVVWSLPSLLDRLYPSAVASHH